MSDPTFERFVADHASVARGLARLVTGDPAMAAEVVDAAWPDVYRGWLRTARSRHPLAARLAPFVTRAIAATEARDHDRGKKAGALELRDDVMLGAGTIRAATAASARLGSSDEDPTDRAVRQAFADLTPRERALVALSVFARVEDRALAWAVRFRPPQAAAAMQRARREMMLTAVPTVIGGTAPAHAEGETSAFVRDRLRRVLHQQATDEHDRDDTEVAVQAWARLAPILEATQQRHPLPWPRPLLVAAAVVAALVLMGGLMEMQRDDGGPLTASELVTPPPTTPAGLRLTGYRSIAVEVPDGWGHNMVACGFPVGDTAVYADAVNEGPCMRSVEPVVAHSRRSSVTFTDPPTSLLAVGRVNEIARAGRYAVYSAGRDRRDGLWTEVILIPRAQVEFTVRSTDQHVLDDVINSAQELPPGYTTVPPCQRLPLREAIGLLEDNGLNISLIQASTLSNREDAPPVTHQTIASGSIVPVGSTVGLGFPSMN